jgi:hypothetical protein
MPPDSQETWTPFFLATDPARDKHIEEELLKWACRVADQHHVWMRTCWPVATSDAFYRVGFERFRSKTDHELEDGDGNLGGLAMVTLQRHPVGARTSARTSARTASPDPGRTQTEGSSRQDSKDGGILGLGQIRPAGDYLKAWTRP